MSKTSWDKMDIEQKKEWLANEYANLYNVMKGDQDKIDNWEVSAVFAYIYYKEWVFFGRKGLNDYQHKFDIAKLINEKLNLNLNKETIPNYLDAYKNFNNGECDICQKEDFKDGINLLEKYKEIREKANYKEAAAMLMGAIYQDYLTEESVLNKLVEEIKESKTGDIEKRWLRSGKKIYDRLITNAFFRYRDNPELWGTPQYSKKEEQENLTEWELFKKGLPLNKKNVPLNQILYGPPGTGKTYNSVIYAVAICENLDYEALKEKVANTEKGYKIVLNKYNELKEAGYIEFITFHQSYGYEEFIEGIKPDTTEDENIIYKIESGVFKKFCENAEKNDAVINLKIEGLNDNPNIWKVSLDGTGDTELRRECLENGYIRIGWEGYGENINFEDDIDDSVVFFYNEMSVGDIVLTIDDLQTIDSIGVVTGEPKWIETKDKFKRCRNVEWIVKGIKENALSINKNKKFTIKALRKTNIQIEDILKIIKKYKKHEKTNEAKKKNKVFIIDEINRGNVSKIFGELITLIEASKRIGAEEEMKVKLPYSNNSFGVPNNVYILGTMNTADRSLVQLDAALRRRFRFKEMMPKYDDAELFTYKGVDLGKLLKAINDKITILIDREHQIGHSYFTKVKNVEDLQEAFKDEIIPLLQEYFYEDYEGIIEVLNDRDNEKFIKKETIKGYEDKPIYTIEVTATEEDFKNLYN